MLAEAPPQQSQSFGSHLKKLGYARPYLPIDGPWPPFSFILVVGGEKSECSFHLKYVVLPK